MMDMASKTELNPSEANSDNALLGNNEPAPMEIDDATSESALSTRCSTTIAEREDSQQNKISRDFALEPFVKTGEVEEMIFSTIVQNMPGGKDSLQNYSLEDIASEPSVTKDEDSRENALPATDLPNYVTTEAKEDEIIYQREFNIQESQHASNLDDTSTGVNTDSSSEALQPHENPGESVENVDDFRQNTVPSDKPSNKQDIEQSAETETCESPSSQWPTSYAGYQRHGFELLRNSCYMDSTLFSLFFVTDIFDKKVLEGSDDEEHAKYIRTFLRNVVSVLRTEKFVDGQIMLIFRRYLVNECNFTKKLLGSFMDAEDFMFILFNKALHLQPFLTYSTGMQDFMHQIILPVIKGQSRIASVQTLYQQSMEYNGKLRLKEIPNPALIILLPRSNGALVGYDKIIPNLELDISELMTDSSQTASNRHNHKSMPDTADSVDNKREEVILKLIAVVCVADYHYTAFVRSGDSWIHYDSMGPQTRELLSAETILEDAEKAYNAGKPMIGFSDSTLQRIFTDCHYCIYQPYTGLTI